MVEVQEEVPELPGVDPDLHRQLDVEVAHRVERSLEAPSGIRRADPAGRRPDASSGAPGPDGAAP